MATTRALIIGSAAIVSTALMLAGCTAAPAPTPTPTVPVSATPTPTPTPTGPIIRPGASAAANQQFFDKVNTDFNAAHGMSDGKSIIDNLVAAGFRKQDMQVTTDRTSIDLPVDSIIFSVRVKGECLIGQFSSSGYHGLIAPLLGNGLCLVGTTRPIDW